MVRGIDGARVSAGGLSLLAIAGVWLASSGLLFSYSYWFDELYSVTAAQESLADAFRIFVLPDVHPPIYTVLLHLWVILFGSGEIATRTLSLLCALGALGIMSRLSLMYLERSIAFSAIALFASSWLFAYFAQETRSYALMLALASLVTSALIALIMQRRTRDFAILLASAFLLSCTHYFGLVYAGLALMASLYWCWPSLPRLAAICITGAACLVWPIIHVLFGALDDNAGSFWIQSSGFWTTLSLASSALTPEIQAGLSNIIDDRWRLAQMSAAGFVFVTTASIGLALRHPLRAVWATLGFMTVSLVVVIVAIDYLSPVSTRRNFIVLLPAFSLLVATGIHHLPKLTGTARSAVVASLCLFSLMIAYGEVRKKQQPFQNIRAASHFVDQQTASEPSARAYFLDGDLYTESIFGREAGFYTESNLQGVSIKEIDNLDPPFYILALQQPGAVKQLIEASSGFELYSPVQTVNGAKAAVLYITR